jgi:hypothetical protein
MKVVAPSKEVWRSLDPDIRFRYAVPVIKPDGKLLITWTDSKQYSDECYELFEKELESRSKVNGTKV